MSWFVKFHLLTIMADLKKISYNRGQKLMRLSDWDHHSQLPLPRPPSQCCLLADSSTCVGQTTLRRGRGVNLREYRICLIIFYITRKSTFQKVNTLK